MRLEDRYEFYQEMAKLPSLRKYTEDGWYIWDIDYTGEVLLRKGYKGLRLYLEGEELEYMREVMQIYSNQPDKFLRNLAVGIVKELFRQLCPHLF